jgi:hypothetical protein
LSPRLSSRQRRPKLVCSNCKRESYSTDYCVSPGGRMAGHTVEEARAAFEATLAKAQRPPGTNRPQSRPLRAGLRRLCLRPLPILPRPLPPWIPLLTS